MILFKYSNQLFIDDLVNLLTIFTNHTVVFD